MKKTNRVRAALVASLAAASLTIVVAPLVVLAPSAGAATPPAVTSGTTYTVVSLSSGKCVDARAAATGNGTAVQQ